MRLDTHLHIAAARRRTSNEPLTAGGRELRLAARPLLVLARFHTTRPLTSHKRTNRPKPICPVLLTTESVLFCSHHDRHIWEGPVFMVSSSNP